MAKTHQSVDHVSMLKRKRSLRFFGKTIEILHDQNDIGIKSWGRIDHLVKREGFSVNRVKEFSS